MALTHPAISASSAPDAANQLVNEIRDGQHRGITAFHLSIAGESLAAYAAPALRGKPPDLRSATKSITAILTGIALERGHIPSLKSRVADLLPEYKAAMLADPRKAAMTVEDLLTMKSGLDCDDWTPGSPGHEDTMYEKRDWLAFWAAVPSREAPGARFSYCTGNVIALGAIIARGSGVALDAFAESALFAPLGITGARWDTFNRGKGIDAGGHLRLQPADFAKIGELVLNGGRWQDKQVVSANWISAMTTAHADIPGRKQRYGYLWWIDATSQPSLPSTRLLMAWGNGGNFLIVMPELKAVAAFTGTRFNQPDALQPLFWLRDHLLPAFSATPPAR
ncbi:MAG: serine hydrolase [Betaproteobacteria bacterium]|nr:serine hydrolase [Betaproteobacteria bacterium]